MAVSGKGTVSRWEFGPGVMNRVGDPGGTDWLVATRSAAGRVAAAVQKDLGRIDLADGATGRPLRTIRTGHLVYSHALSPDGSVLATLDPFGGFVLWDTATGRERHVIRRGTEDFRRPEVYGLGLTGGVALSPDGAVAVASTWKLGTAAYEVANGEPLWAHPVVPYPLPRKEPDRPAGARLVEWPAFAPDGQVLACSEFSLGGPIFRDARTGEPLARFEDGAFRKGDPTEDEARLRGKPVFSDGGGLIGRVGWRTDDPRRVVRVLHSGGQSEFRMLPASTKVGRVVRDAHLSDDFALLPRDPNDLDPIRKNYWEMRPFAFGPNGVWGATAEGKDVVVWDVGTETPVRRLRGHRGSVFHIEWGHDARTLVSSAADRTGLVWDVKPTPAPAEARTPEQLWDDLGGDPATAFRAVWLAADHPQKRELTEHFRTMIGRGPRPDPDRSAAEYWRHKRAVLAAELMDDPEAEKWLAALVGADGAGVAAGDAKAALRRIKLRKAAK